jgi:hypothetical protein
VEGCRGAGAPDACRQPISVGHQWAKSSSSMIAQSRRRPATVPPNSVSAATDATKAPEKKPSLSQHRFWHHYGDGCALVAGSQ